MVTTTTTYSLKKPTVGDDEDLWGGYLNDSMDLIDDVLDGTTPVTGIDINSGTIDNAVIGGTTAAAGTFTTLSATTSLGVTGNITVSGTVDGVDIATRDGVLTTTTTTANAALPKAGGTMTGAITFATGQTFDGRDVSADGAKLDGIESGATADQTKADIDALGIAASTAATLATARNIALTGAVTGNVNFDGSGNVSIATTATSDPTLTLSGDASGSATFTNLGSATLSVTVADDSHNHVISNVDGLQTALDAKLASSSYTASDVLTKIKTVDGAGSGLDADLWDGNQFSTYLNQALLTSSSPRFSNLYVDNTIYHNGDLDTYVGFFANTIYLSSGGALHYMKADGLYLEGTLRENYEALSGTSPTCNVNSSGMFSLSMSGSTTFTFTSPTSGFSTGFVLQLTGNGSSVTWPSSVDWAGGTAPDAPASGETDILVFITRDGGTTWYGALAIDAAS